MGSQPHSRRIPVRESSGLTRVCAGAQRGVFDLSCQPTGTRLRCSSDTGGDVMSPAV